MEFYNFFSFSAKKAIYRASEVCTQFNNQYLEPEHIFYSILNLRSCSAVQVLHQLGANLLKLTYQLEAHLFEQAGSYKGNAVFSQRTIGMLDLSYKEVKRLHHREIGTTHVLIALARDRSDFLRRLFDEHGLDARRIRESFMQHLKGHSAGGPETSEARSAGSADPQVERARRTSAEQLLPDFAFCMLEKEAIEALNLAARTAALFSLMEVNLPCLLCGLVMGRDERATDAIRTSGGDSGKLMVGIVDLLNAQSAEQRASAPAESPGPEAEASGPATGSAAEESEITYLMPLGTQAEFDPYAEEAFERLRSGQPGKAPHVGMSGELARVLSQAFERQLTSTKPATASRVSAPQLFAQLLAQEDPRISALLSACGCDLSELANAA